MKEIKPIQFDFNDIEEVNHRFAGDIIGYIKGNITLPFKLESLTGSGYHGHLYSPKYDRHSLEMIKKDHTAFDWSYPELGYINKDSIALFFSRKPGRYYTRGYNPRYIEVTNSFNSELSVLRISTKRIDPAAGKYIYELFNRNLGEFHSSIASLESYDLIARAFHKDWCVGIKRFSSKPIIFYKGHMVGYYSDGRALLLTESNFLLEELSIHADVEIIDSFKEVM